MRQLDPFGIDLNGVHLVEASAGTGKTHAIASLFLRLLLEARIEVDRILVVTYTVPATDELRIRIRDRIRQACRAFETGSGGDVFTAGLLERVEDRKLALRTLADALTRMDEAAIYTIHGFCKRVLCDMAFESASPFAVEVVADDSDMVMQAAEDFYREHVASSEIPEFVAFAIRRGVYPGWFAHLARIVSHRGDILPPCEQLDLERAVLPYRDAFKTLRAAWAGGRDEVAAILADKTVLKKNMPNVERIPSLVSSMDRFTGREVPGVPDMDQTRGWFKHFTTAYIRSATKSAAMPPRHRVFDACEDLARAWDVLEQVLDRHLVNLKVLFVESVGKSLERVKERQLVVNFDDLLLKVYRAVTAGGGELAGAVRQRYHAALIDEFQDTDRVQYEIFRKCFAGGPLFLIGDPKQAIYGFRGADVFTYFEASRSVPEGNVHTLSRNYRSDPRLVEAFNTIFGGVENPFVLEHIRHEKVEPARDPRECGDEAGGRPPMEIRVIQDSGGLFAGTSQAQPAVCAHVASEIVDLVTQPGEAAARPSDIAVLVRKNWQALMVKQALTASRIPCVLTSDENVFRSREAFEMAIVIDAIMEPRREGFVRCALLTRMFGLDPRDIMGFEHDEPAFEAWVERFHAYHGLWQSVGFVTTMRRIMDELDVRYRLLCMDSGERSLTNLLHLAELLGEAETRGRLGMAGLRKWLAERMDPEAPGGDESQLRLETDEDAVRVMTVHKSKGLEFDYVFCPFAWQKHSGKKTQGQWCRFHTERGTPVFDLGSLDMDTHRKIEDKEEMSEEMRLLYVALTRAKRRCYLFVPAVRDVPESPCGRLLGIHDSGALFESLENRFGKASDTIRLVRSSTARPATLERTFSVQERPACRVFTGEIDRTWKMASYTSIVHGMRLDNRPADRDRLDGAGVHTQPGPAPAETPDIFSFPRGTRAGIVLHEVFEKVDFGADTETIERLSMETLVSRGFDASWTPAVAGMVERVLESDLGGVRLRGLSPGERASEMEFFFPLRRISAAHLEDALRELIGAGTPGMTYAEAPRFSFDAISGYMRGYMDLVFGQGGRFYLVDWKSNHLGNRAADYHPEALREEMRRNHYVLQYHLYCVALDRYLRTRIGGYSYGEHFGGVIYVFLRGVDPVDAPGCGIFTARPEEETVERLASLLVDFHGRDPVRSSCASGGAAE